MKTLPLAAVVRQASEPHKERGIQIIYLANGQATPPRRADNPDVIVCPEVIHSLRNLIQNAVDFAKSTVWIDTSWDESEVRVFIGDDGRGYPNDLLGQIGEPFLRRKRGRPVKDNREQYSGMGLGLFIAKTLLERTGATLTFQNANGAGRGPGVGSGGLTRLCLLWQQGWPVVPGCRFAGIAPIWFCQNIWGVNDEL